MASADFGQQLSSSEFECRRVRSLCCSGTKRPLLLGSKRLSHGKDFCLQSGT
jgi:hypothetical protein